MPAIKINDRRAKAKALGLRSLNSSLVPPKDFQMDRRKNAFKLLENVRLMKFLFNQRINFYDNTHTQGSGGWIRTC